MELQESAGEDEHGMDGWLLRHLTAGQGVSAACSAGEEGRGEGRGCSWDPWGAEGGRYTLVVVAAASDSAAGGGGDERVEGKQAGYEGSSSGSSGNRHASSTPSGSVELIAGDHRHAWAQLPLPSLQTLNPSDGSHPSQLSTLLTRALPRLARAAATLFLLEGEGTISGTAAAAAARDSGGDVGAGSGASNDGGQRREARERGNGEGAGADGSSPPLRPSPTSDLAQLTLRFSLLNGDPASGPVHW